MSDTQSEPAPTPALDTCARCSTRLAPEDRVLAGGKAFCRTCYAALRDELTRGLAAMSENINWPMATLGAVLGGAAGAIAWWGFTVVTHLSFGLVAVVIGLLTALGGVRFAGDKRSHGLQALAIGVSVASFAVANYLVNMSRLNRALSEQGDPRRLGFPPASLDQFARVAGMGFGIMDVVFLAIVIYEAWKISAPVRLPGAVAR